MPITYNKKQREERVAFLRAKILIAKSEWNKGEYKRLHNLLAQATFKWKNMNT